MIEVETKISVKNPNAVRKKAKTLGRYTGTETKIDDYYTQEKTGNYPKKSIRIRKVNGSYIANFKQRLSYNKGVHAKRELEYRVENIKDFLGLIKDFGFRKWVRKEKRCEIYRIKRNFHIELNHVKSLGWFAEIEYLVKNESSINQARKEVFELMKKLGFGEKDAIKRGYTKMLWEKKHK